MGGYASLKLFSVFLEICLEWRPSSQKHNQPVTQRPSKHIVRDKPIQGHRSSKAKHVEDVRLEAAPPLHIWLSAAYVPVSL